MNLAERREKTEAEHRIKHQKMEQRLALRQQFLEQQAQQDMMINSKAFKAAEDSK